MKRCPVIHMDKFVSAGTRNEHTIEQGVIPCINANLTIWGFRLFFLRVLRMMDRSEAIMNRLLKAAGQKIEYLSDK